MPQQLPFLYRNFRATQPGFDFPPKKAQNIGVTAMVTESRLPGFSPLCPENAEVGRVTIALIARAGKRRARMRVPVINPVAFVRENSS